MSSSAYHTCHMTSPVFMATLPAGYVA